MVERVAQVLLDQSQSGEKQNQCNPEYFRHSVVNCSNLKTTQVTTRCTPEEYGSHTFNIFYFFRLLDEYHNMIVLDEFFLYNHRYHQDYPHPDVQTVTPGFRSFTVSMLFWFDILSQRELIAFHTSWKVNHFF